MKLHIIYRSILLLLLLSCNTKNNDKGSGLRAILVTAKYCYDIYPESYFTDTLGVNIYFAGTIVNNTSDTIYIPYIPDKDFEPYLPNPDKDFVVYTPDKDFVITNRTSFHLEESLFYSLINRDTLFFKWYYHDGRIKPFRHALVNLQRHIRPDETKWVKIFKEIGKNHLILDTMKIRYLTPDIELDRLGKILPPIVFERSKKFKIDTATYNSYFEHIFKMWEYYENPPKEYIED